MSDLHPHDPALTTFFNELIQVREILQRSTNPAFLPPLGLSEPLNVSLVATAIPELDAGRDLADKRLEKLFAQPDFIKALPFLLERLNTPYEFARLPRRGKMRNQDRRRLDTFYTPLDVATWLASSTASQYCSNLLDFTSSNASAFDALHSLAKTSICDLSCGSGVLLREAAESIVRAYSELFDIVGHNLEKLPNEEFYFFKRGFHKLQCVTSNLFGIDISSKSIESAKVVLLTWAASDLRKCPNEIVKVVQLIDLNLHVGSGCHWELTLKDLERPLVKAAVQRSAETRRTKRRMILRADEQSINSVENDECELVYLFGEVFSCDKPGFTCILGNPPYGDFLDRISHGEEISRGGLFPRKALLPPQPNQYAKFTSSLVHLLRDDGYGGIVAPLALAYSNAREPRSVRGQIQLSSKQWCVMCFDRSPDALFGDGVKTRHVIVVCSPAWEQNKAGIHTTHLLRWTRRNRADMWTRIRPVHLGKVDIRDFIPKLGSVEEVNAWSALRSTDLSVRDSLCGSPTSKDSTLYYYSTAYNSLPIFRINPVVSSDDFITASPSTRMLHFADPTIADFFYGCFVSSVSFWIWMVESDGFHVPISFIERLPYSPRFCSADVFRLIGDLGRQHDQTIRKHRLVKTNAGKRILNFDRHRAEHIVEQIDQLIIQSHQLPPGFLNVLQRRLQDLILAGRNMTRSYFQPAMKPNQMIESSGTNR